MGNNSSAAARETAITGCLLGTAVGDAIGLPCEGLSKRRARKVFPEPFRQRLLFGKGMTSDDTEHTCMVAQALIRSAGDTDIFVRHLAWRLRLWLLALPAGVGFATLRAILKLWVGFPPDKSGVFSAGNGTAMRSAIIGVCYGGQPDKMRALVRASSRLTHTDPKAEYGALAVALAAAFASRKEMIEPALFVSSLEQTLAAQSGGAEFVELVRGAAASVTRGETTEQFAALMGLPGGVSGYVYHTVPVALHAWLGHQADYRQAVSSVVRCGGDTDTTAAITGAITGAGTGESGIPLEWLSNMTDWPCTISWIRSLGRQLGEVTAGKQAAKPISLPFPAVLIRNMLFLPIIVAHVLRRLLPPY
ncbi:MAG: ADP-ribosylglycohydrolase family protein [Blastocatellia bacterium]